VSGPVSFMIRAPEALSRSSMRKLCGAGFTG
jgi:hypothetical protein